MRTDETKIEPEKITITLTPVDLGKIDLLVAEGLFHNRTDLIRDAIRRVLDQHVQLIENKVQMHKVEVGSVDIAAADLETLRAQDVRMNVKVVGRCTIRDDVTEELAADTIESLTVYGVLRAPKSVLDVIKKRRFVLLSGAPR